MRAREAVALLWLAAMVAIALLAPFLAPADPRQPIGLPLTPPGPGARLGTDYLGRDLWSRLMFGARISLAAALGSALLATAFGALAGLLAATARGAVEALILFVANAALAVPGLLLALLLVAGLGPGMPAVVLAVGLAGAPGFARVARTLFLQVREAAFVDAAEALGADLLWLATRNLLPNAATNLLALSATHYAWAFIGTTTLTFLGLAGDPSLPEWGAMLNTGRADLLNAPWPALLPGLAICLTILAVYTLTDWLARLSTPRSLTLPRSL